MGCREVRVKADFTCEVPPTWHTKAGELGEQLNGEPQGCISGTGRGEATGAKEQPNAGPPARRAPPPSYIFYLTCHALAWDALPGLDSCEI